MAGRGNVRVSIKSDFDDKGVKQAEGSLGRLNNAGKNAFLGMGKAAFGASAALLGAGGLVEGIGAVVKANAEAEVSQAKMEAQLKALGISYQAHAKHIDAVIQRVSKLSGLDDEDLQDSFTNLVRATGDVNKALKLNADAANLARAKHLDVAQAGQILAKVAGGQTNALKRLIGIGVDPVTKAQDRLKETTKKATAEQIAAAKAADKQATVEKALGLIHDKVKGQAAAYGKTTQGAMDRAGVAVENLEEKLGKGLAPVVEDVANGIAKLADDLESGHGRAGRFAKSVGELAESLKPLRPVLGALVKGLGLLFDAFALQIRVIAKIERALLGLYRTIVDKVLGAFSSMLDAIGDAAKAASHLPLIGGKFKKVGDAAHNAADKINNVRDKLDALDGKNVDVNFNIKTYIDGALSGGGGGFAGLNKPAPKRGGSKKGGAKSSSVRADAASVGPMASGARAFVSSGGGAMAHASSGSVTGDTAGLNGDFLNRLRQMSAGTGIPISVTSGFRTAGEQQALVNQKGIWSPSNPTGAAPVGSSMHEKGLAADISPGSGTFGGVAAKYGLAFTVPGEPWHIQPSGSVSGGATTSAGSGGAATRAAAKPKPSVFDRFSSAIDRVDLQVGAGLISERAGDTRKLGLVKQFLPKLRGDNRLRALGIRHDIQSARQTARSDARQTRAQSLQDYRERKATFYDRTLSNPFLTAYLDHQDYLVATGQIDQATADRNKAGALQGAINSGQLSEADVVTATGQIHDLTATPGTPYGAITDRLSEIDAMVRAGDLTPEQGRALKAQTITENLGNPGLSDRERLDLRGDLRDLGPAVEDNTAAIKEQTDAINALKDEVKRQTDFATSAVATEAGAMARWVTEVISKQMGFGLAGMSLGPSYGVARRS